MPVYIRFYLTGVLLDYLWLGHYQAGTMTGVVTRQQRAPAEYNGIETHQLRYFTSTPCATTTSWYMPPVLDIRQVAVLWFVGAVYSKSITEQSALVPDPLGTFLNEAMRMTAIERYCFDFSGRAIDCYYGHVS